MYSVLDIAKYIIWYCKEKGYPISNLRLQKVLYFVQADFLINRDIPCFMESIEAWDFGPVVPEVYHKYKIFGSSMIPSFICGSIAEKIRTLDKEMINEIVDLCAGKSTSELVDITHQQEPWKNAYRKYCNNIITNESIRKYFTED